jgi:phosphomannomutase
MGLIRSVSGIRGIVGEDLNPALTARHASALGVWADRATVAVGRDARGSGEMLAHAAISGLLAVGCRVVDLGLVSTPGVALMVRRLGCRAGLVVTASHNPIEYNGLKFLNAEGVAPPPDQAEKIFISADKENFEYRGSADCGAYSTDDSTNEFHIGKAVSAVDVEAIRSRRFKVVLDPVNGAGCVAGPRLLETLGCDVHVINGDPNGLFAHTPEPTKENLLCLQQAVKENVADIGFAQDPDADRLAVVDETGEYIGEEYSVVLAAKQVWARRDGPAAVNLSTSRMIDDLAARLGNRVIRTPVGEAHVADAIRKNDCVIGGEGNGGVIFPDINFVRDSFAGMALALELLAAEGKRLSEIVADLPRYAMIKEKTAIDLDHCGAILARVADRYSDQRINTEDGVRIDWPNGWCHLRASNTEPIMRIIAEATDQAAARELIDRVRVAMAV